ncbi:MAG TPA: TMEM43 family protein [Gemmataceae bacterium]|nr:TMEM43 family protein [Gemmataceae bacterium]
MSGLFDRDSILGSRFVMILGAILGVVLLLAAIGILFWVEHRAILTAASLAEGSGKVVSIQPDKVDPANDGKLVHLTGEAVTSDTVADPQLGISAKALRLAREVEVYQWKETKTEKKSGKDKTVTYEYTQIWSNKKPPSSFAFHTPTGHTNPSDKPFVDEKFKAAEVKVGAFTLTPSQVDHIPPEEALPVTEDVLAKLPAERKAEAKITADGLLFVGANLGGNPDAPKVGDARIRYKIAKPQTVTVVAKQTGNTFAPYPSAAGSEIDLVKPGQHNAKTMFESAQSSNRLLNWVLRVVSLFLVALGLFLVLRPVASAASGALPEGIGFNLGVAVFAILAALPVVLVVIGARWTVQQPAIGSGLMIAGLLVLGGLILVARSGKLSLFGGGSKWTQEERDHLRRIALDPENPQPRLEFADVLEKKGNPLGEFIRVSHELDAIPEGDERREERDNRWSELLQTHGPTWFQPLRRLRLEPKIVGTFFPSLWMHNGIIDEVLIDLPGILPEKAAQLFEAVPGLRVLEFHNIRTEPGVGGWKDTHYDPDVKAIVRVPYLEQIGVIKMSSLGLKTEDLEAIASSPYLKNLTELDFSYNEVGPEGASAIAQSSTLKRLRVLELRSCGVGEEGAIALAGAPGLAQLTTLILGANAIGPRGASALAASVHLKNLQTLALDDDVIGEAGARAVAASPHFRELTFLDLSGNEIGPEGAQLLAGSANLAKLTTLKLNTNRIGGTGLRFLAASPHLGQLKVLELQSNEIDNEGAIALAASGVIRRLEELSLAYNNIGDDGFKALAAWPGLARVQKLNLRENKAGWSGVKALASSPHLVGLKELDLSKNDIGLAGAQALAGSPVLRTLKYLWLHEAGLTKDAEELLRERFGEVVQLS